MGEPIVGVIISQTNGATVHDFNERLAFSENASHESFWQAIYRKAFPDMVGNMVCSGENQSQRLGIDRIIQLSSGKTIYIDEKKRERDYPDILLEYVSVDTTGAPGWIEKDLQIDYLAYAFLPSQRAYLFPWQMLRLAWVNKGKEWVGRHRRVEAQNKGYKTISVAVPIMEIRQAVAKAALIQL